MWENVWVFPLIALPSSKLEVKLEDWVAVPVKATLILDEKARNSNMWMAWPVVDVSLSFLAKVQELRL